MGDKITTEELAKWHDDEARRIRTYIEPGDWPDEMPAVVYDIYKGYADKHEQTAQRLRDLQQNYNDIMDCAANCLRAAGVDLGNENVALDQLNSAGTRPSHYIANLRLRHDALEAERDRLTRRLNAAEVFIAVRCGPDPNGDANRAYEIWREIRNEDQAEQQAGGVSDDACVCGSNLCVWRIDGNCDCVCGV